MNYIPDLIVSEKLKPISGGDKDITRFKLQRVFGTVNFGDLFTHYHGCKNVSVNVIAGLFCTQDTQFGHHVYLRRHRMILV